MAKRFQYIDIKTIEIKDRVRLIDEGVVEALADDIAEKGQLQPIGVRPVKTGFRLVFGEHRLRAIELLQKTHIDAIVLHINSDQAKIIEIDENILRLPFSPLVFARALATRKEVYETAYPLSKHGQKGIIAMNMPPSGQVGHLVKTTLDAGKTTNNNAKSAIDGQVGHLVDGQQRFSADAAEKLGVSERKIRRAIWLAKKFSIPAEKLLVRRKHPILDNASALAVMAKNTPENQMQMAKFLVDGGAKTVLEAQDIVLGVTKPNPEDKQRHKFIDQWTRSTTKSQTSYLEFLASQKLPGGYQIVRSRGEDA